MTAEQVMQFGPMGPMNGWMQYQSLFVVVILLLLVVIILLFFRQRPATAETPKTAAETKSEAAPPTSDNKLEVALRLLDENERRVVEALVAEGGTMLQKDISINLGFSRVKTHRVVQSLLKRGLVATEEHYNTNRVTLVDWLTE